MVPALATLARAALPEIKDLGADMVKNLAQGAGQQMASSGLNAMISSGSSSGPVSYAHDAENKPATY